MELKIITFNIWDLHLGTNKDRELRFKRLLKKIPELNVDIICLQESWDVTHQYELRQTLTPEYYTTLGSGKIKTRHIFWEKIDTMGGLVIISKFPIKSWQFTPFNRWQNNSLIEFSAQKGFLSTIIDTPDGELRVVTTHLNANGFHPDNVREKQLRELFSGINNTNRNIPSVLCGDLNKDRMMSDPFYAKIISDGGFVRPANFDGAESIPTHRPANIYAGSLFYPAKKPFQFDYILISNFDNMENMQVKPLYFEPPLSDHDPLELSLSLK